MFNKTEALVVSCFLSIKTISAKARLIALLCARSSFQKLVLTTISVLSFSAAMAQEICNNGIDDDANGLIDLNDPQCVCDNGTIIPPTSLFTNHSFEDFFCCPPTVSYMSCLESWNPGTLGSADFMNNCGFVIDAIGQAGLSPFPDGDGITGMYVSQDSREYIGSCLTSQLLSGTSYTFRLDVAMVDVDVFSDALSLCPVTTDYTPFNLTIFGAPTCGNIPLNVTGCPQAPFVPIGTVSYDPLASWQTLTFTFTPTFNVAEVIIGSPCVLPADYPGGNGPNGCLPYLLVDNLIMNTSSSYEPFEVEISGDLCDNNAVLSPSHLLTGGTWQWYENGVAIVGQTNPVLNISALGLGGGNYTVTFNGPSGCKAATLDVPDAEPFTFSVNSATICLGSSATLTVTGTTGACIWSPATGLNSTSGLSVQASPSVTTDYTIAATANGCTETAVATVTIITDMIVDANDATACPGESVTLNATGAATYTWTPATGLSSTTGASVTASVTESTTYTVTGTIGDCSQTGQATVTIDNSVPMSIFATPNPVMPDYALVQFLGEPSNETLTWYFGDNTTGTGSAPIHLYPEANSSYDVLLVVHTTEGCTDSTYATIVVENDLRFYVPNAFTPDGDELNNTFEPIFSSGFDPTEYQLLIFNRWGETIFESHDTSKGWDGTYNGYVAQEGVYTWMITVKDDQDDNRSQFNGHFNLLR